MTRTRITSRPQSLKLVTGGVIRPKETHRLPAPETVSDGDPSRPWMGKRLLVEATPWTDTGADAVAIAMRGADYGYSLDHPPVRRSSGLVRLLLAIFFVTAFMFFAAQFVRLVMR